MVNHNEYSEYEVNNYYLYTFNFSVLITNEYSEYEVE